MNHKPVIFMLCFAFFFLIFSFQTYTATESPLGPPNQHPLAAAFYLLEQEQSLPSRDLTLKSIIFTYTKNDELEKALYLLGLLKETDDKYYEIPPLVHKLGLTKQYQKAEELINSSNYQPTRVNALAKLAQAYFSNGEIKIAEQILEQAERESKTVFNTPNPAPDGEDSFKFGKKTGSIQALASVSYEMGFKEKALKAYDFACEAIRKTEFKGDPGETKGWLLAEIAFELYKIGETKTSSRIMAEVIQLSQVSQKDDIRLRSYEIALVFARMGEPDQATQYLDRLPEPLPELYLKDSYRIKIAEECVKLGRIKDAVVLLNKLPTETKPKLNLPGSTFSKSTFLISTYCNLAEAYYLCGKEKKAYEMLDEAQELVEQDKSKGLTSFFPRHLLHRASAYWKIGEKGLATELMNEAVHEYRVIRSMNVEDKSDNTGKKTMAEMLNQSRKKEVDGFGETIVIEYQEMGLYSEALQIIKLIKNPEIKITRLVHLGHELYDQKQTPSAEMMQLLNDIVGS